MPTISSQLAGAVAALDEFLGCETPEPWLAAAPTALPVLLSDHANCEKKAASTALALTYRYRLEAPVQAQLSRLAREELRHFEQVLSLMAELDLPFQNVSASGYARALHSGVTSVEPQRLIDTLIVCAIVEARSCERFARLAPRLDARLRTFYERLLASEARHFELYLDLAQGQARSAGLDGAAFEARLKDLLARDREAVLTPDSALRFHSGPPSASSSLAACDAPPPASAATP
ncbi:MAG: tRNA isopentenyl-2-thiomethyl-A-37 hydroxylase MiaE [Pseudomonadota bacterium]